MSNTNTHQPDPARQRSRSGKKGATRPTRVVLRLPDVSRREAAAPEPAGADDLPDLDAATIQQLHGNESAQPSTAEEPAAEVAPADRKQRSKKRHSVKEPRSRWASLAMQGLIVLSLVGILGLAYVVIIGFGSGAMPEEEEGTGPMMPGDPTAEIAGVGELQITAPMGEVDAPEWATPPGNAFQAETPATDIGQPMPKATGLNLESPQLDAGYVPAGPPAGVPPTTSPSDTGFASAPPQQPAGDTDVAGAPVAWQETPTSPIYQYNRTDASNFQYPPYEEAGVTAGNGFSNPGVQR